ncbi:MAG: Spy/CpxP family protein refolding chaperone [Blastocatellia bacterium]|nr:Spy/CpxP family protein refolding chaperone [Blastocatellia bacterium]
MKNMPKFLFIALAILLVGVLAIPFAHGQSTAGTDQGNQQEKSIQGGGPGRRHWGHRFGGRLFSQLNLTDAQKAQMKQLHQTFRENTKALRQELLTKRGELRQAQQGDTFNEALATQKMNEIVPLQVKLMGEQFKLKQQISAVLTPEQKATLGQMREQMKAKREQFMKNRAERNANSQ